MWSILNIKKSCRNSFNLSNWTFNQIFKFIETELGMYLHINMSIIRWYKVTVLGTVKWRTLSRKRPKPGKFKVDQLSTTIYIYIYKLIVFIGFTLFCCCCCWAIHAQWCLLRRIMLRCTGNNNLTWIWVKKQQWLCWMVIIVI